MMVDKFEQIKEQTLSNLYDYGLDFSPKGSVDLPIQDLVSIINKHSEYFTTSCCSGRISLARPANESNKGVHWLFVKHGYISEQDVLASLTAEGEILSNELVTMKCEAFIMHICCKTLDSARKLHQIALESGFRESGITLGSRKTMLAIRSTSFSMETPIARGSNLLFDKNYLQILISEANSRMNQNFDRIQRFSQRLKDIWLWPSFTILRENELIKAVQSKFGIDAGHWKRWGHCSLKLSNSDSFLVNGGQGVENKTKSALSEGTAMKSSRNPSSITLNPEGKQESYEINSFSSCMHGQLVDVSFHFGGKRLSFVIQSGGRLSPLQPLKCLNIYQTTDNHGENRYQNFLRVKETGEIPENRWGHSFHRLSSASPDQTSHSFCLFGGRNEKMIFSDIYMLEIVGSGAKLDYPLAEFSLECHWKKISLSCPSSSSCSSELVAISLERFFNASCLISIPLETRNIMIKNGSDSNTNDPSALSAFPVLFFHGGISSLSNPKPRNDAYFIDFENLTLSPVSFTRKTEEISSSSNSMRISRFGHSLTLLDGNCLLLFGGNSENEKENSSYLFDYFLSFRFASSSHDITPTQKQLELVYRPFNSSSITNGGPLPSFPCEKCRSHHQIIYQEGKKGSGPGKGESSSSRQDKLFVVGGGAMTLAFGNHYCEPLLIHLLIGNDPVNQHSQHKDQFCDVSSSLKNEKLKNEKTKFLHQEKKKEVERKEEVGNFDHFVCVPKLFVKSLKTVLEKSNFYNKEMKIQSLRSSCQNVKVNYEIMNIFNDSKPLLAEGESNNFESILNEYCQKESTEESKESSLDWMILPVVSSGYAAMLGRKGNSLWNEIKSLQLPVSFLPFLKTTGKLPKPSAGVEDHHLTTMKGEKGANLFLTQLIDQSLLQGTIPSSQTMKLKQLLLQEIPQKYEVVGDILLIPEQSLLHQKWTEILNANNFQNWKELLTAYFPKMTRIGRKAIIEKSLMRQSQIELLYMLDSFKEQCDCHRSNQRKCFCGISHELITTVLPTSGEIQNPSSESTYGWVTVTENKIKFSFNINKIMFCSGNVTERMRMGQLPKTAFRSNEIVFDLYCGVGYYTLPLLFYHAENIHCLYACEWNLQSILALKHNLIQNEILPPQIVGDNGKKQKRDKKKDITKADEKNSIMAEQSDKKEFNWNELIYDFSVNSNPSATSLESLHKPILSRQSATNQMVPLGEKVKILYGNNAISTQSFANVADRVLLGLLPSSENGWEIAVRLISSQNGGILHLHENVLESDLQSFIHEKLIVKLSNYCVQYQKAMTVELLHVEKVKSYSPHVYHYVFDILLSPQQNNKR
jgi:tRNA wybutosine-synthesizing protein 3